MKVEWKVLKVSKEDKHKDTDYLAGIKEGLEKLEEQGFDPKFIFDTTRGPGTIPFIAIVGRKENS